MHYGDSQYPPQRKLPTMMVRKCADMCRKENEKVTKKPNDAERKKWSSIKN